MTIFKIHSLTLFKPLMSYTQLAVMGGVLALAGGCDSGGSSSSDSDPGPDPSSNAGSSSGGLVYGECDELGARACGDFENVPVEDTEEEAPQPLPAGWSRTVSEGGSVTVSSEQAYTGTNSIKIVSAGGEGRSFLSLDLSQDEGLQEEMFGRMWIYLADDNANAGDFSFLQAEGYMPQEESGAPAGTTVMYRGRIDQRHDHISTNYATVFDADFSGENTWQNNCSNQPNFSETSAPMPQYILPKNEWACVQWHIKRSSNHIDFTVNHLPLEEIRVYGDADGCEDGSTQDGYWYAPERFERLHLGVAQYTDEALPRTVYVDDITLDTRLVECDGTLSDSNQH